MKCEDCKFWAAFRTNERGACRRNAPSVLLAEIPLGEHDAEERRMASWPSTGNSDWCGEFVPRSRSIGFV